MRIFFIITVSEYGGAQSVIANLAERLSEYSSNEIYIVYGGNGEAWKHLNKKIRLLPISEHRKELSIKDFSLALKLLQIRLKYKPDIIHLHSSKMTSLGRIIFKPKSIVCTLHGFDSVRKAYPKYMFVEKLLKNRCQKIIAVSQYDVQALKEENIYKNVGLIYNGVVDHFYDKNFSMIEIPNLRDILIDLKNKYKRIIICIARVSKQKKFDLFVEIAQKLPEYAFVWIGNKTELNNLPINVFCLGEAHSAYVYLRYADLSILPTNYEGLPVFLLESLSFGIPAVASNVGGIPEILDGTNGFAVNNTSDNFVDKITYILEDKERLNIMKQSARQSYLERFTIDKMIVRYKNVFEAVSKKMMK